MQATSPGRGNRSTAWKNVCLAAKLPKRGRFFSFVTSCIIGWWIHGPEARKCSPNVDACAEFNFCSKIEIENRLERLSNQIWNPKERIERTTYRRKWGELTTVKFCRVACRSIQVQKLLFPRNSSHWNCCFLTRSSLNRSNNRASLYRSLLPKWFHLFWKIVILFIEVKRWFWAFFAPKQENMRNFTFQLRFVNVKFSQKDVKRFSVEIHA